MTRWSAHIPCALYLAALLASLPARSHAVPGHVVDIERAAPPPVIDGDLADWTGAHWIRIAPAAPYVSTVNTLLSDPAEPPGTAGTAADLSGAFCLRWDDDYLYLAARVVDNVHDVSHADAGRWWFRDGVTVFLDVDPEASGDLWARPGQHGFAFAADPGVPGRWRHGDFDDPDLDRPPPPATRSAVRLLLEGGFTLEAAIPMAAIAAYAPVWRPPLSGRKARFAILFTDADRGPDWGGQLMYGGHDDHAASWTLLHLVESVRASTPTERVAGGPTIAQVAFWIPPDARSRFDAAFRAHVEPVLKRHGLTPSDRLDGRPRPDRVVCRLIEVDSPVDLIWKRTDLETDPSWWAALRELGSQLGTRPDGAPPRTELSLLRAPLGPGRRAAVGTGTPWPGEVTTAPAGTPFRGELWDQVSVRQGLPDAETFSALQDADGAMWFGTPGGLARYDGRTITTFTTRDGPPRGLYVGAIVADRSGGLWVAGHLRGGLAHLSPAGRVTSYTLADGLPSDAILSIAQVSSTSRWIGTLDGAVIHQAGVWRHLAVADGLPHDAIGAIAVGPRGAVWLGTGAGLARLEADTIEVYTAADGLPAGAVTSVVVIGDQVWVATETGVALLGEGSPPEVILTGDPFRQASVAGFALNYYITPSYTIAATAAGRVWIGTRRGELFEIDAHGPVAHELPGSPADGGINAIACDDEGGCGSPRAARESSATAARASRPGLRTCPGTKLRRRLWPSSETDPERCGSARTAACAPSTRAVSWPRQMLPSDRHRSPPSPKTAPVTSGSAPDRKT